MSKNQECLVAYIANVLESNPSAARVIADVLSIVVHWNGDGDLTDDVLERAFNRWSRRSTDKAA